MIRGVNLLPWREERRQRQRRSALVTSLLLVFLTLGAVGGVWWKQNADLNYQNSRNQFLQQAIARVERQLREIRDIQKRKDELMARMAVIRDLQEERSKLVLGMIELANSSPEGIFFSSLKRTSKGVELKGVAQSSSRISALMEQLTGTPSFDRPELNIINVGATQEFELSVSTAQPDELAGETKAKP